MNASSTVNRASNANRYQPTYLRRTIVGLQPSMFLQWICELIVTQPRPLRVRQASTWRLLESPGRSHPPVHVAPTRCTGSPTTGEPARWAGEYCELPSARS